MKKVAKRVVSLFLVLIFVFGAAPLQEFIGTSNVFTTTAEATTSDIEMENFKGHSYAAIDISMTWQDAVEYCENLGGHLVTITSEEEQKFITDFLAGKTMNCYWMGGSETETDEWVWVTGEEFSYQNWKNDEPNNEGDKEDYLEIYAKTYDSIKVGQWNDIMSDGRNGKLNKSFYSSSKIGLICEWEYEENFNKIERIIDKCTVIINVIDENGQPVNGANIELCLGKDVKNTFYASNGTFVAFLNDSFMYMPQSSISSALYLYTVRAYVSLGNDMYLISDYGAPKTRLSNSATVCIPSDKVQFCPTLSVAYNNSNCSDKKINKLLEDTRKNYFNLTGGKVDICFDDPRPYSSDDQIYWIDSNGNESGAAADIRIRNNSPICNASIDGYWEGDGTRSVNNIDTGFTYYGSQKLDSQTLCHELTHYLFGAWDEYCTGHGGIRVNNGTATNENLYWYDVNDNGIIEDSETHASYWDRTFPRPTNSKGKTIDFGLMDGNNKLNISTYETYSYLEQEQYGGSRNTNDAHPEWYTFQYMVFEESVEETVERVLRKKSGVSTYTYSVSAVDASLNAGNLIQVDRGELEITDATVTNETLEAVLALKQTTSPVCNYTFEDNGNTINLNFTETESSSITVVAVDFENNCISTDVDGVANVSIADNIKTIYICNKGAYNQISVGYIKTNCETPTEITYSGENDCLFAIFKNGIDYTYGDSLIGIANPFSIFAQDEVTQTGTLQQIISRNQNVDFNTVKCVYNDGISIQEIEVTMSEGEHQTLICSFDYLGDGEYCLVAETAKSIVYEAIPVVSFEHVDSVYEKELTITIDESYDYSNVFSYVLYCSETPITLENTDLVAYETFVPGFTDYSFYMFNEDFGKYYFAIQAVGIDGGKSELTIIDGIDVVEKDSDSDGIPDKWISIYSAIADLEDIPGTDSDDDGLTNLQEFEHGTNPLNPDTDGDNVYDSVELWNDLNPLEPMTDGVTDDYIIIYGTPDVGIDVSTFVLGETEVTCSIENNTDGKAMRTAIYLYIGDELVDAGTVNLDSNSSVEYSFSKEYLVDGMRIVLDEGQITRDTDYSNNEFAYVSATGVTADNADVVIAKGTSTQLEYSLTPENATDILLWETADSKIITVSNRGVAIAGTIGTTTVTATTPTGYSCTYNILVEPFPGAGQTDFDCQLINDNTELEIIGYYGSDSDIAIPDSIGGYPVTSIADGAFSGCEFESVVINDGINNIGLSAFNEADNLKSIEVNEENTAYCSVDGVLYNTDKTVLIRYPVASENTGFVVMDAVTMIEKNAFNGTVGLSSIDIPESITEIKSNSFVNTALTIVNYAGSQRMWESLVIANDSGLSEKTICYGKFTATFISEGETISETDYSPGEPIVIPDSAPEKKYYTFVDWTPEVPDAMPECDTIFIPEWTIADNTRTVEFYSDGELYWSDYRYAGEAVNTPEAIPTKEGYTFVKWSPDVAQIMPDEDLQYEAVWDVNIHNVSFLVDGKEYHAYERAYSESVTIPSPPEKEGYVFAGWTPSIPETMPDTELSFTAVFDPIVYTATFTYGETVLGTDEFTLDDIVLDYPAVAEKAGYDWVWEEHAIIPEDITVNGDYSIINYTATFVADGETVESVSFTVENQTVVAPEIPHKDGYTYEWENYEVSLADFTVNAVYTPIIYTATFTSDGEIIGTDEFTVEDASLDYPSMEKVEHYDWVWDEHSIQANDITVDGGYAPTIYTATFIANGETVSVQQFSVEDKTVISPEIPPREGYTSNWQDYQIELVDFTVNAVYTPIKYKATFVDGDKWIGEDYFTVEDMELDYPPSPIKQYYEWNWDPVTVTLSDITVTGYFSPVTYTATFVSNGKTVKTQKFTVENYETVCAPTCTLPQKSGYTRGWEKYEGIIGNITVNEIYLPNNYTAYCYCEGELIETRTFTVETPEERFLYPTVPGRLGYTVEWTAFKAVPRNINLYAEYVPIEYTAQFVVDGDVISTQKFTVETVSLNEPSIPPKAGFVSQWSYYRISVGDKTIIPVYYYPEVITLSRRTLYVGDTTELVFSSNFEETKKVWSSSDNSVATVDKSGKVTAKGEGKCNVTVTCYGKDSAGNDIEASSSTTIIVKEKTQPKTFKQQFREAFNEFFQVKLHDIIHNFKDFMFALVRYTR